MKKCVFWCVLMLFILGCSSVSYYPCTDKLLAPKPKDSIVVVVSEDCNQPYQKIGRLVVRGGTAPVTQMSEQAVVNDFFKQARKRGADGVVNIETNISQITRYWYSPPSTTYQPIQSYTDGSFRGNTSYGTSFSGNYSDNTTTMIPVTTPGYTVPINIIVPSVSGDLVVFDTFDPDTYLSNKQRNLLSDLKNEPNK